MSEPRPSPTGGQERQRQGAETGPHNTRHGLGPGTGEREKEAIELQAMGASSTDPFH